MTCKITLEESIFLTMPRKMVALAMEGFGCFAAPIQHYMGTAEEKEILNKMLQDGNRYLCSGYSSL